MASVPVWPLGDQLPSQHSVSRLATGSLAVAGTGWQWLHSAASPLLYVCGGYF